jgi:hypothetical protein
MCGSPASVSAYCRQLSFSLHREIIEFRVRGGNQYLVKIISRGIVYLIFRARMFPDTVTNRLMTGMFALIFGVRSANRVDLKKLQRVSPGRSA